LTGHHWRYTAGVSGCYGIRTWYPHNNRQPLWKHAGPGILGQGPTVWSAADQPTSGDVHSWDVNAMYLGGLKNARVAWSGLDHTGPQGFDPALPGWWEIDVATIPGELWDGKIRPPLFYDRHVVKGAVRLSTERVKRIAEQVGSIDVLDSWTCPNSEPVGRRYAERLIAARAGDLGPMGMAGRAVKATYSELVGMVAREGGSIWRPDWAATWMDLSAMNMMRRVDRVGEQLGQWPIAVRTDAVYYATDDPDLIGTALGVGTGVGKFKKQETLTADAYRAKFAPRGRK
jgi:hypothetical protein